jgi:sterol desaturase/sphingolipid hydroxylase (fatty acid hydroxylase superfamily)
MSAHTRKIQFKHYLFAVILAAALAIWISPYRGAVLFHLRQMSAGFEGRALARDWLTIGFARHLIVPAIFAVEYVMVGWTDSSIRYLVRPSRSILSDITVYGFTITKIFKYISIPLTIGIVTISAQALHQNLVRYTGIPLSVTGFPIWAQVLILFFVYTFFDYWAHRADHSKMFWPLHRYHHAAEEFCVLTSDRVHPATFTDPIIACSIILLGGSTNAFVILYAVIGGLRHVIHSRIDSGFGWVGRFLVQSPRHHRLHHALDIPEGFGNFSLCPIWDRLFGTWREPPRSRWNIGVPTPYRQGAWIFADIWRDYMEFWANSLTSLGRFLPTGRRIRELDGAAGRLDLDP